jgi:Maf1 regulator
MKYLENIELENLTKSFLTGKELGGTQLINGRCEVYSTKKAGDDKKQSRVLEQKLVDNNAIVDSDFSLQKSTTKLFVDLIQTLNASLADYDFTDLKPESFTQISCCEVVQKINSHLAELTAEKSNFLADMWRSVDGAIGCLGKCEAFQLIDDPFSDEMLNVWSFHYFLYNKELKRICYFSCAASARCHNHRDFYGSSNLCDDSDDDIDCDDASDRPGNCSGDSDDDDEGMELA